MLCSGDGIGDAHWTDSQQKKQGHKTTVFGGLLCAQGIVMMNKGRASASSPLRLGSLVAWSEDHWGRMPWKLRLLAQLPGGSHSVPQMPYQSHLAMDIPKVSWSVQATCAEFAFHHQHQASGRTASKTAPVLARCGPSEISKTQCRAAGQRKEFRLSSGDVSSAEHLPANLSNFPPTKHFSPAPVKGTWTGVPQVSIALDFKFRNDLTCHYHTALRQNDGRCSFLLRVFGLISRACCLHVSL
ncbi:hypothetical protein CONLIGDRAFT_293315 [Coniochaeta ligniaria NRRL 30616]|uniref:Uncharacterized protein n=1 Tax=Coniochaeta ligniaria NRRL 30616 TaxID=1408157 RepID=A0A1J7JSZ0_9PEZI|nr:hypothetical protein CONLIGDRAFT_293315 [Coniochaeta ligniaria NRRL 30616]